MSLRARLRARLRAWLTPDHFDSGGLDDIAYRMLCDYSAAVVDSADRAELANILTGKAGCNLAMSWTYRVEGWNDNPAPGEPEIAESERLAGLLLQEIASCAAEGTAYQGVRCRELDTEPVGVALRLLAVAYHGASAGHLHIPSIGQRLDELGHAVLDVIGSSAAECLVPLMIAHSYNPYACDCERCGDPAAVHLSLPAEEQARRERATRGCAQP